MTQRQRPMARPRRQTFLHSEDRQTFLVTAVFISVIVLAGVFLVGAVALAYYNEHLRPVARVGNVELGPGMVREHGALLRNRILLEQDRITAAIISRDIEETAGQFRQSELQQQLNELNVVAVEGLIDRLYQSQLAAERGITVSEQEIDQRLADELALPARRQVLAIIVEPQAEDPDEGPTLRERRVARERAEQAMADIEGGRDWADVAREYSTDDSAANGGDLGTIIPLAPPDEQWMDTLFALPEGGTTDIMVDQGGVYRIGRVTQIQPAGEEPGARGRLLRDVSDERYREFVRYELAAEKLEEQVVAEAIATPVDQIRLAEIFIDLTLETGDEDTEQGEIHYSEIVYAPNGDIENAPDLADDDPAWDEARQQAETAYAELEAITDPEQRAERFAELAFEESDSPSTGPERGDAGFLTRGLVPEAVGDALFDEEHEPGELIGPVRSDAGYIVLLFHEHRDIETVPPAEERLQAVRDALAQPGADFAAIARELSESDTAEDGGELGWFHQGMIPGTIGDELFELQAGDVSDMMELGSGYYFFKATERQDRALDVDQRSDARRNAFERWYAPLKDQATDAGVISRADDIEGDPFPDVDDGLEPGFDQGVDFDDEFDDDFDLEEELDFDEFEDEFEE